MDIETYFECELCGSPAVTLPNPLTESGSVRCGACHVEMGSWLEYKLRVAGELRRFGMPLCADPIKLDGSLGFVARNAPSVTLAARNQTSFDLRHGS